MHSCCGKKRAAAGSAVPNRATTDQSRNTPAGSATSSSVAYFQYVGGRMLTVLGEASGQMYHFVGHGALVAVDPRDRRALAVIPGLKEMSA